jgi:hypothetical protein
VNLTELIDRIADLPDKSLDTPVLIWTSDWQTVRSVVFDENRVILHLEKFE